MKAITMAQGNSYQAQIVASMENCLTATEFTWGKKYTGKVRDTYEVDDKLILITTDRLSGFNRVLTAIPFKGQVLNLTCAWWFEQTEHIVPNHVLALPDPNVTIAKKCTIFPVEFHVRGYMTGTATTSLWASYQQGVRAYCGHELPAGLAINQKLTAAMVMPTTKDVPPRPLSAAAIVRGGIMTQADWDETSALARQLYDYGAKVAADHGLLLVDAKYEFGKDAAGNITLCGEIHTPDSSNYWLAASYPERFAQQQEPESIDLEIIHRWMSHHCDPYQAAVLPAVPAACVASIAERYLKMYEMITGNTFSFVPLTGTVPVRIMRNIAGHLA